MPESAAGAPTTEPASETRARCEETFNVEACKRLIHSNRQYQDEHGYYLPTLAWLLNETRRERDEALARAEAGT